MHFLHGLLVAFRVGATEVAFQLFGGVFSLAVADDHEALVVNSPEAAEQSGIVPKGAVAVQLHEVVHHELNVVGCQGTIRVASCLNLLPGRQLGIDGAFGFVAAFDELLDLIGEIDVR